MSATFMVTVTGVKQADSLQQLASLTHQHQGTWLTSRTVHLEGYFASIFKVSVPNETAKNLQNALEQLTNIEVKIAPCINAPQAQDQHLDIQVEGRDRAGLVQDITRLLVNNGIQIDSMACQRLQVQEAEQLMFLAKMALLVPPDMDLNFVRRALEEVDSALLVK